jgi:hypothetical protein
MVCGKKEAISAIAKLKEAYEESGLRGLGYKP